MRRMGRKTQLMLVPAVGLMLAAGAGLAVLHTHRSPSPSALSSNRINALAIEFARIALQFAQHKPDEVDSYFGPASLRPASTAARVPLDALAQRAHHLVEQLDTPSSSDTEVQSDARSRQGRLLAEARALATVIDERASGTHLSFDDEARKAYGMPVEQVDAAQIDAVLAALDRALPASASASPSSSSSSSSTGSRAGAGSESLASRFGEYRKRFAVPADRRRAVFEAALDGCRARTAAHWSLPAGEHLDVKWDPSAPGAWHRYDGRGRSTLTINPAAVEFIDTAVDLACHEGYPGHHAQFLLADRVAGIGAPGSAPLEGTVALLRSPSAMLREGAANYAVDLAFPADERLSFERDTLFPIAGFNSASAGSYFEVRQLVRALEPAIVPILREYRDGRLSSTEAAERLESRALVSSPQALLRFVDDLGPYVLGYTVARDRVASYVANQARSGHGNGDSETDAWTVLKELLTTPDPTVLSAPPPQPPPSTD
jgi:hypothetical protein